MKSGQMVDDRWILYEKDNSQDGGIEPPTEALEAPALPTKLNLHVPVRSALFATPNITKH